VVIVRARIPLVKFKTPDRLWDCDLCFDNLLAVHNTQLLRTYASIDERVRIFGYVVKYWAKRRLINESSSGTLSSYSYILLVIHFFQVQGLLPNLQHRSILQPSDMKVIKLTCIHHFVMFCNSSFGLDAWRV
jgi:DNA polymerase sigma